MTQEQQTIKAIENTEENSNLSTMIFEAAMYAYKIGQPEIADALSDVHTKLRFMQPKPAQK